MTIFQFTYVTGEYSVRIFVGKKVGRERSCRKGRNDCLMARKSNVNVTVLYKIPYGVTYKASLGRVAWDGMLKK